MDLVCVARVAKVSDRKVFDRTQKFIKDFSLKQCYHNVWRVEKIQKVKIQVARRKNERIMILLKCAVYDSKKSKFIKQQEASGILSNLGIKTPFSKISLVGFLNTILLNSIK